MRSIKMEIYVHHESNSKSQYNDRQAHVKYVQTKHSFTVQ